MKKINYWLSILLITIISFCLACYFIENRKFYGNFFGATPWDVVKNSFLVIGALATFAFTTLRTALLSRDVENKTKNLITEDEKRLDAQFADLLKALGDQKATYTVKLGAVYALSQLALKSENHLQQCLDVLCSLNKHLIKVIEITTPKIDSDYYGPNNLFESDQRHSPTYSNRRSWINGEVSWSSFSQDQVERMNKFKVENQEQIDGEIIEQIDQAINKLTKTYIDPEEEDISRIVIKVVSKILRHYFHEKNKTKYNKNLFVDLSNKILPCIDLEGCVFSKKINFKELLINSNFKKWLLASHGLQKSIKAKNGFNQRFLNGSDFSYSHLKNTNFDNMIFDNVNLMGAELYNTCMKNAKFNATRFDDAIIRNAKLQESTFFECNLSSFINNSDFSGANFEFCYGFIGSRNIENVNFEGARFIACQFSGSIFSERAKSWKGLTMDEQTRHYLCLDKEKAEMMGITIE